MDKTIIADDLSLEDFYDIQNPSPKEAFLVLLTSYYNLDNIKALDIAETAVDLFRLDKNGKIPIDWVQFLQNQA